MRADSASKRSSSDKVLTVQVHHENLDPRTFKVPVKWIFRSSILAWLLIVISMTSVFFAIKTYRMKGGNQSEQISELEKEIHELKTSGSKATSPSSEDVKASDTKPDEEPGQILNSKDGIWTGLAPRISLPPRDYVPTIELNDVKIDWQGKYALISGIVAFREQGKGSQQGHLVVLARGKDRIIAHPDDVLNLSQSSYLFNAENGEYFSVARFRILKAKLGPFESPSQLNHIQVYIFDTDNKLILTKGYSYEKK